MKKTLGIILTVLVSALLIIFTMGFSGGVEPREFYIVYLDGEELGVINSKSKLEDYINDKGEYYKNKYKVNRVYSPNGLEIRKTNSYQDKTDSIESVYEKIIEKKPLTISGQQITVTDEETEESKRFYVIDKNVFENSLEEMIITYIGKENYNLYKEDKQEDIKSTGTIIEDIYVDGRKTIKETTIPVDDTIYTDSKELTRYLMFGDNKEISDYVVQPGDNIASIAFSHEISAEEFLISNPEFTNVSNLLYPGQIVKISATDPQIKVVKKEYIVKDTDSNYKTDIKYDDSRPIGQNEVIQKGENGLDRITQRVETVNGIIYTVDPISREELKPATNEILVKGDKYVPDVGDLTYWAWPTNSGWTISEDYGYRINPIAGYRELHGAIDIAGTGYGSNIYAANNGRVETVTYSYDYGNYIIVNHNNGYHTLYSHLSRSIVSVGQIVERGEVIGYMGQSGWATGTHLHFEVWLGGRFKRVSPWSLY